MKRLITYTCAAVLGLLIAALLSIPNMRAMREWQQARANTAPAPVATLIAAPGDSAKPPADNATLLTADIPSGQLTVTVNGAPAGSLQSASQLDITRFCSPGANVVRLMWVGPAQGSVTASHTTAGVTRDLSEAHLLPADTQTPGVREMTFYL